MTRAEKDVIRAKPCSLCLAVPPFSDGSRCHVHRIIRGKDGGLYVEGNTIPLCPPCHRAIDRVACITGSYLGGRNGGPKGGRIGGRRVEQLHPGHHVRRGRLCHQRHPEHARRAGSAGGRRVHELHPEHLRDAGRRGGRQSGRKNMLTFHASLTTERRSEILRGAAQARAERKQQHGLTPAELAHVSKISQAFWATMTPAERSAHVRKGWVTRRAEAGST